MPPVAKWQLLQVAGGRHRLPRHGERHRDGRGDHSSPRLARSHLKPNPRFLRNDTSGLRRGVHRADSGPRDPAVNAAARPGTKSGNSRLCVMADDNPIPDQDELDLAGAGWEALTRRRDDLRRLLDDLDRRAERDRAWGDDEDFVRARQVVYSKFVATDEALLEAELWMARAA